MSGLLHRILYRLLPLEGYLRVVSSLFFLWHRLGLGRRSEALEYVYHLPQLVRAGDVCIDIGANLGYYARTLARLAGPEGRVYAVEPVAPVRKVLSRNLRRCVNTEIIPYALGGEDRTVVLANDSARETGYLGTGRNFVKESGGRSDVEFVAEMRRGSGLFGGLKRLDFIKCDVEGYELHILREMRPVLERHRPTVLIETGGENRPAVVRLFGELGYRGYTLADGREVPLTSGSGKDIIFRYQK
ncbi:FkbM family methyltransferase [uncultured Alistipes sp.]|uniref:FkbM family methyltransferase n=1 Tax=uncultured Alistipes sp. TaxID=538949 RepID=UPI002620CAFF|nr:FkbM family methyltransferase [uncultured Alistipes sp.]